MTAWGRSSSEWWTENRVCGTHLIRGTCGSGGYWLASWGVLVRRDAGQECEQLDANTIKVAPWSFGRVVLNWCIGGVWQDLLCEGCVAWMNFNVQNFCTQLWPDRPTSFLACWAKFFRYTSWNLMANSLCCKAATSIHDKLRATISTWTIPTVELGSSLNKHTLRITVLISPQAATCYYAEPCSMPTGRIAITEFIRLQWESLSLSNLVILEATFS